MKKVFFAISVLSLLIVFTGVQSFSAQDGKGPKPKAGGESFHVYDANDQFLGILVNYSLNAINIFIPTLSVFTCISNYGDICFTINTVLFELPNCVYSPDTTYLLANNFSVDNLFRIPANNSGQYRYFYSITPKEEIIISLASKLGTFSDIPGTYVRECRSGSYGETGYGLKAIEILEEDLPFTLPVALPLRYELQSP